MDENDFGHFFLFLYPLMEQSQHHPDWPVSDPPAATPFYTQPPQAAEPYLEPSQTPWASQIPYDQETVGLPGL